MWMAMGDILVDSASHNSMRQPPHPLSRQVHVIAKMLNCCQRRHNLLSARSGILTQDQLLGTVIAIMELDKSRLELIGFLPEISSIKTKTNGIKHLRQRQIG